MAWSGDGSGTVGDPYIVETVEQLQEMDDDLQAYYALGNDIDCSDTEKWNPIDPILLPGQYYGFKPLGPYMFNVDGQLDGRGFAIQDLYINRPNETNVGLFGLMAAFTGSLRVVLKDIKIENANIICKQNGGIMVGAIQPAGRFQCDDCEVSGTIESRGDYGGTIRTYGCAGFVGWSSVGAAYFNRCVASALVTATQMDYSDSSPELGAWGGFGGVLQDDVECIDCYAGGSIILDIENSGGGPIRTEYRVGGFSETANGTYLRCTSAVEIVTNIVPWDPTPNADYVDIGGFCQTGGNDIKLCTVTANINQLTRDIDSLVGGFSAKTGQAEQCVVTGTINNYSNHNPSDTIHSNATGGFHAQTGIATDCYCKVNINPLAGKTTALQALGGFIGENIISFPADPSAVDNCYCASTLPTTGTNIGGFTGRNRTTITGYPTDCFFDSDVAGTTNTANPQVGRETASTTTEMKTRSTFEGEGWDFTAVWYMPTWELAARLQSNLTLWLSRSGDYDNFEEGVDEDDAFTLTLPTTNEIRWIKGLETLVIGTSEGEWKLASNKLDTPLSPQAFSAKEQTTYGSAQIQALAVNASLLFVDYVRRKVREITYLTTEEKYVAPDMTELAEHITKSGIVDMAHQKNPDSILWCVLANGTLISMVYDREQDVVAWSHHETQGTVQSVCVIPNPNAIEDEVWISVRRSGVTCIEKMMPRGYGDILEDAFFVDSGLTFTSGSTILTGFDHLVGKELVVMGDGVQQVEETPGDFTVSPSGSIRVPAGLSKVHAGLPFEYALKPMRIVLGSPTGTSYGSITRVSEIVLSFLNTLGVNYGDKADNQYAIDFTDPRWENEEYIDGLFSGDVVVAMPGGFSVNNPILITGSGPYPFTLRAMIVRLDKTGR
jgi:hypothetical protein